MTSRSVAAGDDAGTALAEFAVVAPVMLALLFTILGFGSALFSFDLVTHAARLGTRWAIVRGATCTASGCPAAASDVQTYVQGQATGIDGTKLAVTTNWAASGSCTTTQYPSANGPGCLVTVKVTYPFTFVVPFVPTPSISMSAQSQMIIAQ